MAAKNFKTCIFGASPGTGNQGVDALCWSTLNGLAERGCSELHVFGFGGDARPLQIQGVEGSESYVFHGMSVGKRVWRGNHLGRARLAAASGMGDNALVREMADADLVLDVSGGDSFTDLYGGARFRATVAPKEIALRLGRRLVLLPQTYGPFRSAHSRRTARRIIAAADLAYARDPDSFRRMQELLGNLFDAKRHREGVDLAFRLAPRAPKTLGSDVAGVLYDRGRCPLIGLNISGLIANDPHGAASRFGLSCNYRRLMRELLEQLLEHSDARILITPHVHAPLGHYESDLGASLAVLRSLPARFSNAVAERVAIVRGAPDARELKWLISKTNWFCGTRMHATIAALSSGVPTAALAYSLKTRGVFASCNMADAVVDLRGCDTLEALGLLVESWNRRDEQSAGLARALPLVRARAARQMDEIVGGALAPAA